MKRLVSLLLALVMIFNLTACIRIPARKGAEATAAPTAEEMEPLLQAAKSAFPYEVQIGG